MTHDCSYHGTYSLAEKTCTCDPGWTGPSCAETDCSCGGHGDCVVDARTGVKVCVCDAGYSGAGCESKICPSHGGKVCGGVGLCVSGHCRCPPGLEGAACEHTPCEADCSHHGKCVPSGKGLALGTCKCDPGWGGKTCSVRQCAGLGQWTLTLCSGHGACLQNSTCACMAGWQGLACAERSCPDGCHGRGVCKDGVCFCANGFDGPSCQRALCPTGTDHPLQAGVVGAVCSHRGVCGADGTCRCHKGASGTDCSRVACSEPDCSHRGVCVPAEGANGLIGPSLPPPVCKCNATYYGDGCEYKRCDHECGEAEGRGQCAKRSGTCACKLGWKGEACEVRACEGGCGEAEGRGACKPVAGSASLSSCVCTDAWFGERCELRRCPKPPRRAATTLPGPLTWAPSFGKTQLPEPAPSPESNLECSGRGDCQQGVCICVPGFAGGACELPACPNDCSHRGTCVREGELPTAGGAGLLGLGSLVEGGGGRRGAAGGARCVCDVSYTGVDCTERECPNNCSGVGHCSISLDYKCVCPAGYSGVDCSVKSCGSHCLEPRGRCIRGKCLCAAGWSGDACDRPSCPAGCSGHGQCTFGGCVCEAGWYGDDCAHRGCGGKGGREGGGGADCGESEGRGSCFDGKCYCAAGFFGPHCRGTCGDDGSGGSSVASLCSGRGRCTNSSSTLPPASPPPASLASKLSIFKRKGGSAGQQSAATSFGIPPRWCECEPGYAGNACEARTCLMGCSGHGLCKDGTCVCALGYAGPDCAETTAPNSRDCGTGCVHLCATQCALANANGSPGPSSSGGTGGGTAAAYAALALGQVNGEAAGVGCFAQCRKRCVGACASFSGQRALWASGRRRSPSADLSAKAQATRALGLSAPSAATLGAPPVDEGYVSNTLPHPVEGRLEALTSPFKARVALGVER